jgi:hypothetical protein
MAEIYGHRWTSAYGENPGPDGPAGTWAKGLAGIGTAQVAAGLEACLASSDPWPPTLPQFRAMCLGIPSFAEVRLDNGPAKAPFTRLVWQYVDGYALRQASSERADRMLRDGYELAREYVMRGGELPPPAAGELEQERRVIDVAAPDVAAAHLEEIRKTLGMSRTEAEAMGANGLRAASWDAPCGKDAAAGPDA